MSFSIASLEKYRIPLEEIVRATNNFSSETKIGDGGFGSVHKGQLSEQWQNHTVAIKRLNPDGYQGNEEFCNELEMVSSFNHPNIIHFIGFCDDAKQMIIVYEYAINGSLDHHIQDPEKRCSLTWEQRLKLCLGAARGLEYLHSGLGEHKRVIHRDVKSANILLDDNLDAKICDFGLSRFGARNQENTQLFTKPAGTRFYMDPIYVERSRLTKESDVYSFGIVMFEISSGALVYHHRCFGSDTKPQYLIDLVRSYYDDGEKNNGPDNLIDPFIRGHIHMRSFHMFNNIAHECLNMRSKERPTINQIIQKINDALDIQLAQNRFSSTSTQNLKSFLISLKNIKLATKGFSEETRIGYTLFGDVYKGELSKLWPNPTAIKRLDPECYRGEHEFYRELQMISFFHHQNILHFIGYYDKAGERIVVHEYAPNGSLADHLSDRKKCPSLRWTQRLKIIIGAARALQYLQFYLGEDSEVIRGQINSGNIMLDKNMEAKISFFGLSKQAQSKDQPKKSDVFSLGVILCQVLTGHLSYRYIRWGDSDIERDLLHQFVEKYQSDKMDEYVDGSLYEEIDSRCYNTVKEIAYQCIITDNSWTQDGIHAVFGREKQEAPPSIVTVIERLEYAAHFQELEDSSSYRVWARSGSSSGRPRWIGNRY